MALWAFAALCALGLFLRAIGVDEGLRVGVVGHENCRLLLLLLLSELLLLHLEEKSIGKPTKGK